MTTGPHQVEKGEGPKRLTPRIVFFGLRPPPVHGVSLANGEMLRVLEQRGFRVDFVPFSGVSSALALRVGPAAKAVVALRSISPVLKAASLLLRRDCQLYLPLSGGIGQLRELALVVVARGSRRRIVLHHHTYAYIAQPQRLTTTLLKAAGSGAAHIVQCESMGRDLRSKYPATGAVFALSNIALMDLPKVDSQPARRQVPTRTLMGFLGNGSVEKGALDALEVFRTLAEDKNDSAVRLEICGPLSPQVETVALSLKKKFGERLVLHGPKYGEQRDEIVAEWNVLLFPSRELESEGRVIHEAMALGAAVVATPVGCLRQFLLNVESAHIVAPDSDFVQEAAGAIARFEQVGWDRCAEVSTATNARLLSASALDLEIFLDSLARG